MPKEAINPDAGAETDLRALQHAVATRFTRRSHLQLRMHLLRRMCRNDPRPCLSELWGGFVSRPIRPATNWKGDNYLGKDPASSRVKHRPVDSKVHAQFAASIRNIPPERR
jgi:hypothetical protein